MHVRGLVLFTLLLPVFPDALLPGRLGSGRPPRGGRHAVSLHTAHGGGPHSRATHGRPRSVRHGGLVSWRPSRPRRATVALNGASDSEEDQSPPKDKGGASVGEQPESLSWLDLARRARQPNRRRLQEEVSSLARGEVAEALGPGFRFEERGSLFSPLVQDVTGADILMFGNHSGGAVGTRAAEAVLGLASSVLCPPESVLLGGGGGVRREVPWSTFERERDEAGTHGAGTYERVVVSGIYRTRDRFLVPMCISVSVGKDHESINDRLKTMTRSAAEGDYAKALQKVRGMVKSPLKREISHSINRHIGPLRFLVKQLKLLQDHPDIVDAQRYTEDVLGLGNISIGASYRAAEEEMQRRAMRDLAYWKKKVARYLNYIA